MRLAAPPEAEVASCAISFPLLINQEKATHYNS